MELRAEEISRIIRQQIQNFEPRTEVSETGSVLTVGDGVARVYGLARVQAGELVEFNDGIKGLVLNLDEDSVGIAIMGSDAGIREGDLVKRTGRIADIAAGDAVLEGRRLGLLVLAAPERSREGPGQGDPREKIASTDRARLLRVTLHDLPVPRHRAIVNASPSPRVGDSVTLTGWPLSDFLPCSR